MGSAARNSLFGALALLLAATVAGCASVNCRELREQRGEPSTKAIEEHDPMKKSALADRVRVYKPDGSLQCDQGRPIPVNEMRKELGDLVVHSSSRRNDGLMRIQKCGTPTGQCNVYEIDRTDLAKALALGFTEWTFD